MILREGTKPLLTDGPIKWELMEYLILLPLSYLLFVSLTGKVKLKVVEQGAYGYGQY